jgi:hypothetical protein
MEIDRSPSLQLDSVVLPKGEWEFDYPVNNGGKAPVYKTELVSFVPGTWIKAELWMNKRILAAFSCPNCKAIRFLVDGIHTIDHMGRVKPDVQCKARSTIAGVECSFHRRVFLDRWNKKPLYAVAIENWNGKVWTPEIRYTHADNEAEARFMMGQGPFRIVSAGPAIGFFVEDKVGDKLNVSAK